MITKSIVSLFIVEIEMTHEDCESFFDVILQYNNNKSARTIFWLPDVCFVPPLSVDVRPVLFSNVGKYPDSWASA